MELKTYDSMDSSASSYGIRSKEEPKNDWTFLSNHAHVLICLHRNPEILLKNVAIQVGITERAVMNIIKDLVEAGILEKVREGRRNSYIIHEEKHLRHPIESSSTIRELLKLGN